jgi:hypothetical protein
VVQPLIIEATGESIVPAYSQFRSQKVTIIRTAENSYDDIFVAAIGAKMSSVMPDVAVQMVTPMVVPKLFNVDDKQQIHNLARMTGTACMTEMEVSSPGFNDFNLAATVDPSDNIRVEMSFNNPNKVNSVGLPIRADMSVVFGVAPMSTNPNNTIHGAGNSLKRISTVSGFIDLLWAPVANSGGYNPYIQQQQPATQKYVANMVITDIESTRAYTVGSMLMAIATSLTVRDNSNWIQYFRPIVTKTTDTRDIGALNIECNLLNEQVPTAIDTKADGFSLTDLGNLVAAVIQPGLLVSMDISNAGSSSWYMNVFKGASKGDQKCISEIINSANQLTNQAFGKYFPVGTPIFANVDFVHQGYYTDSQGVLKDIREIDYLAVANWVGIREPNALSEYSDTFTRSEFPAEVRLQARKKMIESLCSGEIVITSVAERVTFSAAFLNALAQGVRDTGTQVTTITPLSNTDFNNTRAVAGFVNDAMLTGNTASWNQRLSTGYGGYNGNGGNQGGGYYR